MAINYWIAAMLMFGSTVNGQVELNISPPGDILQGDTVTITCSKASAGPFDVLKIYRVFGNAEPFEVMTNGNIQQAYQNTGRYRFLQTESALGKFVLQISGITGADRGEFQCLDLKTRNAAVEEIMVMVPPKRVYMKYHNDPSGSVEASEGENVVFIDERDGNSISCNVDVEGSVERPRVTIRAGDEVITAKFTENINELNNLDDNGLYETFTTYTYTATPDLSYNGKTIECQASMPGHSDELKTNVQMEMHYKPALNCEPASATLGSKDVMLTCTATMYPAYNKATWDFDTVSLNPDSSSPSENHHASATVDGDKYKFMLHIKTVNEEDFRTYSFSVDNGVGGVQTQPVVLVKVDTTTTTMKPSTVRTESTSKGSLRTDLPTSSGNNVKTTTTVLYLSLLVMFILNR